LSRPPKKWGGGAPTTLSGLYEEMTTTAEAPVYLEKSFSPPAVLKKRWECPHFKGVRGELFGEKPLFGTHIQKMFLGTFKKALPRK